ncbi:MOFRL family protein [Leptospira noguchii serovar Autumnalis str. ZUN142]|uniref:MOFRL family protein n=1 Tax=Leptospira noguchii serovar Autumnalis str. ZUN142 TaxID=1085540 RepID=M6UGU6_9LEPT|nr:MOFRL family protein [Leptospira noguchii serovar Autumnalis str. ZUN142]
MNIPVLLLTSSLSCEAKEAGFFLGEIAKENLKNKNFPLLILCGGETTVTHDGSGKGGRNQELALSFSKRISGCQRIALFSLATDGSDGPTDAAGAIVDGTTWKKIYRTNDANLALKTHNSYEVLNRVDSLVFMGATGTNVNDIQFLLLK